MSPAPENEPLPRYVLAALESIGIERNTEYPEESDANGNSRYSVEEINAHHVAWLRPTATQGEPIFAGVSVSEFVARIEAANGKVYLARDAHVPHPATPSHHPSPPEP